VGRLDGRIALVTGGTGALGQAVCAAFAAEGARLVVTYVKEDELPAFRAAVPAGTHELVKLDVTQPGEVAELVRRILADHERVDILANLVGGFFGGIRLVDTALEDLDAMLEMNLKTAFICAQAVLPAMILRRHGRILNVSARPALEGGASVGAYAIAKAGVAVLTRVLADEVRHLGVTVNAVAPSTIDTPANRTAMPKVDPAAWVDPAQIAATLVFLASDAAAATSGAVIPIYARA
jgi:NAD(P)-dependent dehydrogenase (short-subunit alcohol dehydrogenase family)